MSPVAPNMPMARGMAVRPTTSMPLRTATTTTHTIKLATTTGGVRGRMTVAMASVKLRMPTAASWRKNHASAALSTLPATGPK